MASTSAIEIYIRALLDVANVLQQHKEARSAFDPGFLFRSVRDGFFQTLTEDDQERILYHRRTGEEFLLWQGPVRYQKINWNCIGWIFPFSTIEEMERAYELVIRAELEKKSWSAFRQFWLTCRLQLQEAPLKIPTNIIKVRVMGEECRAAMENLEQYPPNLRYVVKTLLERLPSSNYLRNRLKMKLVVGEKLEPYVQTLK